MGHGYGQIPRSMRGAKKGRRERASLERAHTRSRARQRSIRHGALDVEEGGEGRGTHVLGGHATGLASMINLIFWDRKGHARRPAWTEKGVTACTRDLKNVMEG